MLAGTWRIIAVNNTGVAFGAADTITVTARKWKINGSTGVLEYDASAPVTVLPGTSGNSLAIGGIAAPASPVDNTTDLFFGADLDIEVVLSTTSPSGNVDFYLQTTANSTTPQWPDDASNFGEIKRSLNFTAAGTQKANARI